MTTPTEGDLTSLLQAWSEGDESALEHLVELVYPALKRMAAGKLASERAEHTLQPTALVHEAFLRLVDQRRIEWRDRVQFFGVASRMMRRVLVDSARSRHRLKRGGGQATISLDHPESIPGRSRPLDVLDLDRALQHLESLDERKARVVELHFFGGLTTDQTAEVLQCSRATVGRDWRTARAWLARELAGTHTPKPSSDAHDG